MQMSDHFAGMPLILASGSPRRKALLEACEVPFTVVVSEADESFPSTLSVADVPEYIAGNKAKAVARLVSDESIILAADTIVVVEKEIIGKPVDEQDAKRMLRLLSGKTHLVYTGVVLIRGDQKIAFTECTEVEFYALTDQQIDYYVEKFQPLDKAGAYGIQEWIGYIGIKMISGDYYNVMGLPVSRLMLEIQKFISDNTVI